MANDKRMEGRGILPKRDLGEDMAIITACVAAMLSGVLAADLVMEIISLPFPIYGVIFSGLLFCAGLLITIYLFCGRRQ